MKRLLTSIVCSFYILSLSVGQVSVQDFQTPPNSARPSTYWMWMNGNITKEGLTEDLKYMKRTGYGQAMMFNTGVGIARGPVDYASPAWDEMTLHACKEANSVGIELMMHNSPGYSGVGGPWITPEYSMQQLEWTETLAAPDKNGIINVQLPRPYAKEGWYRDVYVLAYPALPCETALFSELITKVTLNAKDINKSLLIDNDLNTQLHMSNENNNLVFELSESLEVRSITIRRGEREKPLDPHDGPRDYAPILKLEASQDGVNFYEVSTFSSQALREMDTPLISSFDAVRARFYRITTNRSTNISEVNLHTSPRLERWTAKTNYAKDGVGLDNNLQYVEPSLLINPAQVIDITDKMNIDGKLCWKAPKGDWTIIRIGHTTTGEIGAAAPSSATGLEVDKFSKEGVDKHFDLFLDPLLTKLKPYCGSTLIALVMDSWEVGKQNWTVKLPEYFKDKRGYDLRPYLLSMTGRIIGSVEETEKFLWDMRRIQADMFNENFIGRMKERSAFHQLKLAGEPYGDGNFESLEYAERLDYPMSEFWVHYIYGGVMTTKLAASNVHVFGKPIVAAESFTGTPFNSKFTEHPYAMKALGDWMMTLGVNKFVYHVYAHQPYVGEPGILMTMGPFGTHLDRNSTWAEQAIAFNAYNSRCAYMLQQGLFVADILYLKNEEISSGIPDYDVTEPITPYGYKWDITGRTALFSLLSIKDSKIVLPDGMNYQLLVVPNLKKVSPEVLRRMKELVTDGMSILLGDRPDGYMGMDEKKNREVQLLVSELWDNDTLGEGRIYKNMSVPQVLKAMNIRPDFSFMSHNPDAQIHFIHRTVNDEEVYFVTNHRRRKEMITATFRVSGLVPEMWNAETGETNIPIAFREKNGMTSVTLKLQPSGSIFIVFRKVEANEVLNMDMEWILPREVPEFNTNTFSISLWAKPETFAAVGRGYLLYPMSGEKKFGKGHAYVGLSMGQNTVRVHERESGNQTVLEYSMPVEGWTHIALVYNEGIPTLYLNGEKVVKGKKSAYITHPALALPAAEEQYIGSFEGDMSPINYKVWALNHEEINGEFRIGLPAPKVPEGMTVHKIINNGWKVQFPEWSRAPAEIVLPILTSLHKHEDFNVKHFSGTAIYRRNFNLSTKELKEKSIFYLDLGRVENMASVTLNGNKLGLLWKAPYRIDITDALIPGENQLVLEVTNLYPNRMICDEHLPDENDYDEYGRINRFPLWYTHQGERNGQRVLFSPWKYYTKDDPLLESGLLGPVRIFRLQ
jgi:hypothetical protein